MIVFCKTRTHKYFQACVALCYRVFRYTRLLHHIAMHIAFDEGGDFVLVLVFQLRQNLGNKSSQNSPHWEDATAFEPIGCAMPIRLKLAYFTPDWLTL